MNIYLDINGVLLGHDGRSARHVLEFLKGVTDRHTCYWLTTHCRGGENRAPEVLAGKLPPEAEEYINKIIPTDWGSGKTEAINFGEDFRWIDDEVYESERKVLAFHNSLEKLIVVNLRENPDQLRDILDEL